MSEQPPPAETELPAVPESEAVRQVREQAPDALIDVCEAFGIQTLTVKSERLHAVMTALKTAPDQLYTYLVDLTAVDRLNLNESIRFVVVYQLYSYKFNRRLCVKTLVPNDTATVPSVVSIWPSANWMEREVYDLFGVVFDNHPDLRRLVMPDDFGSYPLRKDYPLHGKGERDSFVF